MAIHQSSGQFSLHRKQRRTHFRRLHFAILTFDRISGHFVASNLSGKAYFQAIFRGWGVRLQF